MNGFTSGCNVTGHFGETVGYYCINGYYVVGTNPRTCQTGGNWTGSDPTCEAGAVYILISMYVIFYYNQ